MIKQKNAKLTKKHRACELGAGEKSLSVDE